MLKINDLVKIYPGPVAALKGVTLEIPQGLFGLLGPNGAGKSTLMNILAGLLEPTGGSVALDGADIVKDPRAVWRQLGYLPQDFGFYPSLTGAQMLDFLLRLKGVDAPQGRKALVGELLERVNLAEAGEQHQQLIGHLLLVAARVARQEGLDSFRTVINSGAEAGQTVFHLHVHVIGGRPLDWPPG